MFQFSMLQNKLKNKFCYQLLYFLREIEALIPRKIQ